MLARILYVAVALAVLGAFPRSSVARAPAHLPAPTDSPPRWLPR